jgi:hypothetical protein
MAHALARRRGGAGDEADHRLLDVLADELAGFFLGAAADLADHDDALGARIVLEQPQAVDEVEALDRIAADADAGRLAHAGAGHLPDRLVGQRAAARDDADLARLVDVGRHDADLAAAPRMAEMPGQLGPISRVLRPAWLRTNAMSATDASVIATTRSRPASTASQIASAANAAGT